MSPHLQNFAPNLLKSRQSMSDQNRARSNDNKKNARFQAVSWICITSSGARAMRGFRAMCLLRRSRCVFLAPQCTALRCPWVSAHVLLVVHVPSCARGPLGVLFIAHLHMYNKSVLLYRTVGTTKTTTTTNERTKFHLIYRIGTWRNQNCTNSACNNSSN